MMPAFWWIGLLPKWVLEGMIAIGCRNRGGGWVSETMVAKYVLRTSFHLLKKEIPRPGIIASWRDRDVRVGIRR